MSLIFNNYKYNEKYNQNNPNNFVSYRQTNNYEKERRRLLEKYHNNNINKNYNYGEMNNMINNNDYKINSSPNQKANFYNFNNKY